MRLPLCLALLALTAAPAMAAPPVTHATLTWQGCRVEVLTVAPGTRVVPAVARPGKTLEAFVREHGALAGINGGYFNHSDGWPVSHVRVAGQLVTDPEHNHALLSNPALKPVMGTILNHRSEWRHVTAGWAIAPHDAPAEAIDSLQAGPQLLPVLDLAGEAFVAYGPHHRVVRDGIGAMGLATRSALGLRADGSLIMVGVGAPGLTLAKLAAFMREQGATSALGLDGGSSTGIAWHEGGKARAFHGGHGSAPLNSVLLVGGH